MTHTPHDLHAEFPGDDNILHALKLNDSHFQRCANKYHDINREIHRIEIGIEAASDTRVEELKKARLALLDEVSGLIATAKDKVS